MAYAEFENIRVAAILTALPGSGKENSVVPVAPKDQTASDLGFAAASRIIADTGIDQNEIGSIIFASKTPDYRSPATSCVLQGRLALSTDCIAFDMVIGSSGFAYGLQTVCSLLSTSNKQYALLIAGDTTSKQHASKKEGGIRFGDGTVAVLLEKTSDSSEIRVLTGADGSNWDKFAVMEGGFRYHDGIQDIGEMHDMKPVEKSLLQLDSDLFTEYASKRIPLIVRDFLEQSGVPTDVFDYVLLQQIGRQFVEHVRNELSLPQQKVPVDETYGADLCAASIPALLAGTLKQRDKSLRLLACSIGEGFSWGCVDFQLDDKALLGVIRSDEIFSNGQVSHTF